MSIDWEYPEKGKGLSRIVDELIGPGATRAEIVLVLSVGVLGGCGLIVYQYYTGLGWNLIQIAVAAFIAFDIAGGVVANSTSTAKRWYHREEQGPKQHIGFIALHFIHPLLIVVFFLNLDWFYFVAVYGFLIAASVVLVATPLYLRRPISATLFGLGLLMSIYVIVPVPGLEWFIPLFYLKLIVGHMVREEPYRPD
ncbi:MAG: hypothetical protein AM324_013375 [Candidatus Thorarchaeota archaeon SMTZ1-83]|nr:MAG: hypothetical protein AM324_14515 [Candidatus Thorarchaeota archaeon SMTZ1-83]